MGEKAMPAPGKRGPYKRKNFKLSHYRSFLRIDKDLHWPHTCAQDSRSDGPCPERRVGSLASLRSTHAIGG